MSSPFTTWTSSHWLFPPPSGNTALTFPYGAGPLVDSTFTIGSILLDTFLFAGSPFARGITIASSVASGTIWSPPTKKRDYLSEEDDASSTSVDSSGSSSPYGNGVNTLRKYTSISRFTAAAVTVSQPTQGGITDDYVLGTVPVGSTAVGSTAEASVVSMIH